MRNAAIVAGALLVLAVGLVFVLGSDDEADAPGKSTVATTTETVTTPAPATTGTEATTPAPAPKPTPEPEPEPSVPTVAFADGKPKGGVKRLAFDKGEVVEFKVVSDVPEEIHIHGYDIYRDVAPGKSTTFRFDAKFDGKYEIEVHDAAVQVASLEIQP